MIDIHSHILYGIDDGSDSIEESIKIIEKAKENGVTDIICTPHYIYNSEYNSKKNSNKKILDKINKEVEGINLYLGNEVFITDNLLDLLKSKEISSLNNTKYILIELPLCSAYHSLHEIIFQLRCNGYIPIIAHPERYLSIQSNPASITHLLEHGALLQSNIGSVTGFYGKRTKKTVKYLLKNRYVQFMSSDVHHDSYCTYDLLAKAKKKIKFYTNQNYMEDILINNPRKLIENEDIEYNTEANSNKGILNLFK